MAKETRALTQMYRVDGRDVFMEVCLDGLPIDKVILHFVKYDAQKPVGKRIDADISIYLDVYEARRLSFDIQSGRIVELGKISKNKAEKLTTEKGKKHYPNAVFLSQGGKRAKDNGGIPQARTLELVPGDKVAWVFVAKFSSNAHETPEGLIVMDGKPEAIVRVPLTNEFLKELSFALEYAVQIWALNRFTPVIKENINMSIKAREASIQRAVNAKKQTE